MSSAAQGPGYRPKQEPDELHHLTEGPPDAAAPRPGAPSFGLAATVNCPIVLVQ
jgi:hypothetical protein